jgi:hypothetical protein
MTILTAIVPLQSPLHSWGFDAFAKDLHLVILEYISLSILRLVGLSWFINLAFEVF